MVMESVTIMTGSVQEKAIFPSTTFTHSSKFSRQPLPDRPCVVEPIFDLEYAKEPLYGWDIELHGLAYSSTSEEGVAVPSDELDNLAPDIFRHL